MGNSSWIDLSIERGPLYGDLKKRVGLRLFIRANPELEKFMQNLSNGKTIPIEAITAEWVRIPQGNLSVYAINFGKTPKGYTLGAIGSPLLIDAYPVGLDVEEPQPARLGNNRGKEPAQVVNLSFLAIAGISEEEGLTIGISGVYSYEYIMSARSLVMEAVKQFLHDYLVPVTINLQVTQRL